MYSALSVLNNSFVTKCVNVGQCECHTADLNLSSWLQQLLDSGQDKISMIFFSLIKTDQFFSSRKQAFLSLSPWFRGGQGGKYMKKNIGAYNVYQLLYSVQVLV